MCAKINLEKHEIHDEILNSSFSSYKNNLADEEEEEAQF